MSEFPFTQALVLAMCKISEATVICFIMPFVNEMVAGFGHTPAASARYSGIIESALVLTEAIFAPLWGQLADRHGRKHLLVIGLMGFTVASIGIGLSQNLWMAVLSRCLSGIMGAVAVLVRTIQFEMVESRHLPQILGMMTPCWAIGAAVGPFLGGLLAHPADTMPFVFGNPFWTKNPYLLSAIGAASFPAATAMACWKWIPETLGRKTAQSTEECTANESALQTEPSPAPGNIDASQLSFSELVKTHSLLYPLFGAGMLAFVSMGYCSAFMMFASASIEEGGLGLSPKLLGFLLATSSILGIIVSTKVLPVLVIRLGYYRGLRWASFAHVLLFIAIALSQMLARIEGKVGWMTASLLALVLLLYELGEMSYTFLDVAFADRTPAGCLGKVNGLAASAYSIGRMLAPIASGLLWSCSADLPKPFGPALVWFTYSLISIIWWITTLRLHSQLERSQHSELSRAESGERGNLGVNGTNYSTFVDAAEEGQVRLRRSTLTSFADYGFGAGSSNELGSGGSVTLAGTPRWVLSPSQKKFRLGEWNDEEELAGANNYRSDEEGE